MTDRQKIHRRFNNALTAVVVVMALYLMIFPFLPLVGWWTQSHANYSAQTVKEGPLVVSDTATLKIPRLNLNEEIHTGPTAAELSKGVWLIPRTSTPDKKSNTVIVGHRFTYAGPAVFYFLDKMQTGDSITIDWNHKEYTYQVKRITVVPPTQISVQAGTSKPILTLYTCTPLLTAKDRLVIQADLIKERT